MFLLTHRCVVDSSNKNALSTCHFAANVNWISNEKQTVPVPTVIGREITTVAEAGLSQRFVQIPFIFKLEKILIYVIQYIIK